MVQPGVEAGQQEEHSEIPSLLSTTAIIISHIIVCIINVLIFTTSTSATFGQ